MPAEAATPRLRLLQALSARPRWQIAAVCAALSLAIGAADAVTGHEVGLGVIYLAPVLLAAWLLGRGHGISISFLCGAVWLAADQLDGYVYAHPAISYWNALVHLSVFLIAAGLASRLRSALELEKRARETAESASRLKSEMVSLVSHELGNGLALAVMSVFMLRESDPSPDDASRAKYYSILSRAHDNLKAVASNFLNLARLESGKFKLEIKPTELRAIVRDTVSLFDTMIEEKRLRLDLDFPAQVIPIHADRDCMKLVLNNLIGNAVKYTPAEGRVGVRLVRKDVDGRPMVTVSVEDTGIGFPMGESDDIFSGFHRTTAGKRMSVGYGIGLKVSRDMVEHHGSRLMAHSAPGKGSRFYFDLPICTDCKECTLSPV